MKSSRIRLALLALICGTASLHADILVLKSGTRVEGNILSESPDAVRMRYRLTPKIWDEKDFPRTDIDQVIKQSPEEVELIELRKLLPTADLMAADQYEQLIQDRLRPFANKYKGTKEAKEVETMIAQLQDEKAKVASGQAKLEGKWLTAEEAKGEQFNIEAYQYLKAIRAKVAAGKWSEALREYDAFHSKSPALRGTRYYPAIIAEALTALDNWLPIVSKMAAEQPVLKKDRDAGLRKLEEPERTRAKDAIEKELSDWKTEAGVAKANRLRWIEPYKYDSTSVQASLKEVTAEKQRLAAIDLNALKVQNEAFGAVLKKIGEKDYAGGANAFQQIAYLGNSPQYKDLVADLKARLMVIYGEIAKKSGPGTGVAKGSSAIAGTGGTQQDELVAKIMAEAAGGTTAPATTAPAPGVPGAAPVPGALTAPGMPAGAVRPPTTATPVGGVAPGQAVAPAAAPVRPVAPAPVAAAPTQPMTYAQPVAQMAPVEEESNFQTYLLIGAGVLILVLLVAFMQQKKKNEA